MKAQKFMPLVVVAVGLLAYHNSFTGPFIFDDRQSIQENLTIRHLWPVWQVLSPPASTGVSGRPVLNFSLAINYAFGGTSVQGYHALNLAIHILAALTLFGVVRRTLVRPALRDCFGTVANGLALAIAAIWTVHPVQTEAVTYVSQRAESLMGLFCLLTLYCFIRGTESQRSGLWFTLSIVACLLGMATKEMMVTAPLMVLLYDQTFVAGSFQAAWTRRWRVYMGLAGTWLLLAYLMTGLHGRGVGYGLGITWQTYALTECQVVVNYLWLALWPHPLIFDYGTARIVQHAAEVASCALILVLLAIGVLVGLKRRSAIGFIGAWFFVILAPTSSVVPVAGQPMAESRLYLPLAAVVAIVVIGIHALAGRRSMPVFLVLAVGLGFLTVQRNQDYRSQIAIWGDTVAKRPGNPRAHYNLGCSLWQEGRMQEAMGHWEQAVRLKPDYAEVQYNLGLALSQVGRFEEAIGHYEQTLRLTPDDAEAHNNLGVALLGQSGRVGEAIGHLEQAVRIKPDFAEAHNNLGNALTRSGRIPEAIDHLERALQIKPDNAAAHYNLGVALEQTGKFKEAVGHYEEALQIKPEMTAAQNALARLQARQ